MLHRSADKFVLSVAGAFLALACLGGPLDHWHWRNPMPQGNSLLDVTANAQGYVAVGDHGTIVTSPDGEAWSEQVSGTLATLRAVAFGAGRFIAVGDFGTILTSTNATNWDFSAAMTLTTLRGVTYADDSFLVVGDHGLILSSADGNNWSAVHTGPYSLDDVAFGGGLAVAVGGTAPTNAWADGKAVILTSTNRIDWISQEAGFPSRVHSVCFGNGLFAATTSEYNLYVRGFPSIGTSSNGVDWTHYLSPFHLTDVAIGSNEFVAIGPAAWNVHSDDGLTWQTNSSTIPNIRPQAITYGSNGFVAVGLFGRIARSPDGVDWTTTSPLSAFQILDVEYGNGFFLALAGSAEGDSNVWLSADGATWRAHAGPGVYDVTFGNGVFVGTTEDRQILTTSNAVDWITSTYQNEYGWLGGVAFRNGIFIVTVPVPEHVLTSPDGLTWTLQRVEDCSCVWPIEGDFVSLAFGKGLYVGTTWNGEIWSSSNGTNWVLRQEGAPIVGNQFSSTFSTLSHVTFGGGVFVAVGGYAEFGGVYGNIPIYGTIYTSPDGIKWTRAPVRVSDVLRRATYGSGTLVAIGGESNTILQCDPFVSLSIRTGTVPRLLIEGPPGAAIEIEASDAPSGSWTTVHSATLGTVPYEWADPGVSPRRFYRALFQR
jgi:hypothetical protein